MIDEAKIKTEDEQIVQEMISNLFERFQKAEISLDYCIREVIQVTRKQVEAEMQEKINKLHEIIEALREQRNIEYKEKREIQEMYNDKKCYCKNCIVQSEIRKDERERIIQKIKTIIEKRTHNVVKDNMQGWGAVLLEIEALLKEIIKELRD